MAVDVIPPTQPGNKVVSFYHAVVAEMKRVTWPEVADVRRATIAIIVFVLLLGLLIWVLDLVLQGLLVRLIPSLFTSGGGGGGR
jgi:preprotein translocase subunit SecE